MFKNTNKDPRVVINGEFICNTLSGLDKKNLTLTFNHFETEHFGKDVFQVPYHLGKLYNLPSAEKRGEQIKIILDAYELNKKYREGFIEIIMETIICETAHEAIDENITFESVGNLWGMAWRNRSLYWIFRNKKILKNAII
jgi:hypothetical protein